MIHGIGKYTTFCPNKIMWIVLYKNFQVRKINTRKTSDLPHDLRERIQTEVQRTGTRCSKTFIRNCEEKGQFWSGQTTACPSDLLLKPKTLIEHRNTLQKAGFSLQAASNPVVTPIKQLYLWSYCLEPNYPRGFLETLSVFLFLNILEISNKQYILKHPT